MSDTPTPRTDAAEWRARTPGDPLGADTVYSSFARQLERELAEAKADDALNARIIVQHSEQIAELQEERRDLEAQVSALKALLQKACAELPVSYHPDNTPEKLASNIAGFVKDYTENYRELDEHRDELARRGIEIAGYINQLAAIHSPESGVWRWQGDGSDHPESMVNSLPVVMTASTLREKQAEVRSLREQLTAHKVALERSKSALLAITSGHFYQSSCRGGEMERLMNQAIEALGGKQ